MTTYDASKLATDHTGPGSLSYVLGFDTRPIIVHPDGTVTVDTCSQYYAPGAYCDADGGDYLDDSDWEFFSAGYTGQYGYSGPVMHVSETLTGGLARDILATPGVYAAVVVDPDTCDDFTLYGECGVSSGDPDVFQCSDEPAGWAIVRRDVSA